MAVSRDKKHNGGRVLFIGDSITEQWSRFRPHFFPDHGFINRGLGGQTTRDIRARFVQEVRGAEPEAVHILGGINDIAGNGGPIEVAETQDSIGWMMARAAEHGCRVLVASLTPAAIVVWNRSVEPLPKIAAINEWLRAEAVAQDATFLDYHEVLRAPSGGLRPGLGPDGLHLNAKGYRLIEPVLLAAVAAAVGTAGFRPPSLAERARRLVPRRIRAITGQSRR